MKVSKNDTVADVCLILEGTYPYVHGGVSSWTHELIKMHSKLNFSIIALVPMGAPTKLVYELPPNVIDIQTWRLQELPEGQPLAPAEEKALFTQLEQSLRKLQSRADLADLASLIDTLAPYRDKLGHKVLMDSPAMWDLLLHIYESTMPKTPFLDYFWSWRGLFGGLFSLLINELPKAKTYHALCTGYAGLLLARAHLETGRPCLVTEHGIYTNERRIEIASADWIEDPSGINLAVVGAGHERDLKDLWIDTFGNYSHFCYEAASEIITLYEGNQEFQRMDGADPRKMQVIPNGIEYDYYQDIERKPHPPSIALIGRVVPIKDIKTYIKAVQILKQSVPDLQAYVLGPADEDPAYARECRALVEHLQLGETITFTGKVNVREYFDRIDVNVLTSLSEAMPLVILEAGAAGIPSVATDVGACREMILGGSRERPALGAGGGISALGSPLAVAHELQKLLTDRAYYESCSQAIRERVRLYYSKEDQYEAYANLYSRLINAPSGETRKLAAGETRKATKKKRAA